MGTEAYNLAIAFFVNPFATSLFFHYQVCILEAFWKYKMKELSHNFFKNLPSNFNLKANFKDLHVCHILEAKYVPGILSLENSYLIFCFL